MIHDICKMYLLYRINMDTSYYVYEVMCVRAVLFSIPFVH